MNLSISYRVEPVGNGFEPQVFDRGECVAVGRVNRDYKSALLVARAMAGVKAIQAGGTKDDVRPC